MNILSILKYLGLMFLGFLLSPFVLKILFEKFVQHKFDSNLKSIQHKFDTDLEEVKSKLTKLNNEHSIRYSKLHEDRYQAIKLLYSNIVIIEKKLYEYSGNTTTIQCCEATKKLLLQYYNPETDNPNLEYIYKKIESSNRMLEWISCIHSIDLINAKLDAQINDLENSLIYIHEMNQSDYSEYLESEISITIGSLQQKKLESELYYVLLPRFNEYIMCNNILFSEDLSEDLFNIKDSFESIFLNFRCENRKLHKPVVMVNEEYISNTLTLLDKTKKNIIKQFKSLLGVMEENVK